MKRRGFNIIFQMKDVAKFRVDNYNNPAVKLFKRYFDEEGSHASK